VPNTTRSVDPILFSIFLKIYLKNRVAGVCWWWWLVHSSLVHNILSKSSTLSLISYHWYWYGIASQMLSLSTRPSATLPKLVSFPFADLYVYYISFQAGAGQATDT
jgi:hypothetical protein